MPLALIEELYGKEDCETIKQLFLEDISSHLSLREAIGNKIILEKEKILTTNALDALCLICLTSKFASSEDECHRVAITIYQFIDKPTNTLPSLFEDSGLQFASKTLMSLSFRAKALEKRWKYHGAPSPSFYRKVSKTIFVNHDQKDIAAHHEQWEGFLGELFI